MNGNDDFFGGAITPPSAPSAGQHPGTTNPHLSHNKEYASYSAVGQPQAKSSSTQLPLIIGTVVLAVVGMLAFAGYRFMFDGTQIEIPDTLLGLEKVEFDSSNAQLQQGLDDLSSELGADADVEIGLFQGNRTVLFVMGGEAGTDDLTGGAEGFFSQFEDELPQTNSSLKFTEVDPGPNGGRMKCLELPTFGLCAWVNEDAFGTFTMSPLEGTAAQTALEVREAIEK